MRALHYAGVELALQEGVKPSSPDLTGRCSIFKLPENKLAAPGGIAPPSRGSEPRALLLD